LALSGEIAKLVVALQLDDSGFTNRMRNVQGTLGRVQGGFSQMGKGVGQVGSGLARLATIATAAAAGGLTAVITTAASFEQAFTGIEKTVDETANTTFPELEEAIRKMARSIPVSFEELAGIGEAGGALGIAADDLEEFIDVVARLAVSTDLSSEQAATALGQLGNVLHLTGDDFRDLSDSLVALGNAGASTESQIVEIAARFAAAGNSAGLSKEEILALGSAVASMGIEVEAGGSALSRIFNNVTTNIGTSSKKAVAFADTMGLTAKQFKVAWERDALGTFQNFLRELGKLDQFEQARVLKAIGITNTRDVNTIRLMSQNIGLVNEQLRISEKAQGDLNKESQKFFDTTTGQWKTLINIMRDAGVTIGFEVLPVTKKLIKEFSAFMNRASTQTGLKNFGKDLAGGIRSVVRELKGADFSGLIDGMKLAGQIASRAFGLFRSLPPEIQALAVGAIALNKVSGGAIGGIAKGFANIFSGAIKVAFPKLDIFSRGSPVNPMFVKVIGGLPGPMGGAPGWLASVLGAGSLTGLVTLVSGIAAPFLMFNVLPSLFPGKAPVPGSLESNINTGVTLAGRRRPDGTTSDPIHMVLPPTTTAAMTGIMPSFARFATQAGTTADVVKTAINVEGIRASNAEKALLEEAKRHRLATIHLGTQFGSLEQRLIQDKTFKPKIDASAFIRILRRTSEFGQKGVGTTIELGRKTGRDPVGDAFVALVKRVKDPLTPKVFREISNHIIALEEVQRDLLRDGKIGAARHAQRNINALHRVIGSVDKTKPLLRDNARHAQKIAARVAEQKLATERGLNKANSALGIIQRKDFEPSFNANIYTTVNAQLSTYNSLQTINRVDSIRYNGKLVPIGF
jgi:TP901 family phage tail tape measure protein